MPQEDQIPAQDQLAGQVRRGIKWMALAQIVSQALVALVNPTMSRLLSPEDVSAYNIVMTALGFFSVLASFGFNMAIIQRPTLSEDELCSAFWASTGSGLLLALVGTLSMPFISWYYENPDLFWLGIAYSLTFALSPLILVPIAILTRRMSYNKQAIINILMSGLSAGSSIVYALLGYKAWSWVLGTLTMQIPVALLALKLSGFVPKWHFRWNDLRGMREFSAYLTAETGANYLFHNMDYLAVSKILGDTAHGYYTQAYALTHYPYNQLTPPVNRVLFSAFSRQQNDDEALSQSYLQATRSLAVLAGPILCFIAVASEFVVGGYFGEKWLPIVPYVRVLALIGWLKCIVTWVGLVINAKGHTKLGFRWSLLWMIVMTAGVWIGVRFGVLGVCWAWVIVFIPQAIVIKKITHNLIGLSTRRYLLNMLPAFFFVGLCLAGLLLARVALEGLFGADRVLLVGFCLLGLWAPFYLLGIRALCPAVWSAILPKRSNP